MAPRGLPPTSRGAARRLACALALALATCPLAPAARAADAAIDLFETVFLPESVTIDLGDTVLWIWRKGSHRIASGRPDGAPGTPDEPGALFDVLVDQETRWFATTPGLEVGDGFSFFCRDHPGQVGHVRISSDERSFRVGVVDNFFLPDAVRIFEGDSVRWEHEPNEGFHTITSGRSSSPEDDPGALFDEPSSDADPIFEHRFAEAGEYPYFCRPHEHMGMVGTVLAQRRFLRGDATADGGLDISDPVAILVGLFLGPEPAGCPDARDADDDGAIGVADSIYLLAHLFLAGPPPPRPNLAPGADRTEDGLDCDP